jgi:hypothetical protein
VKVFIVELHDSVEFSAVQTVMEFERMGEFRLSWVRLGWTYSLFYS